MIITKEKKTSERQTFDKAGNRKLGEREGKSNQNDTLDYEPPGKCSTIRSGGGEWEEWWEIPIWEGKCVCDASVPRAKERLRYVLSLAPGNVYWRRKSKTARGDVYCT